MENFPNVGFDVFSLFNDRWALVTAGTPERYNTMTIGWGTMGTIWGPAGKGKQIIEVFLRENRGCAPGKRLFYGLLFPGRKAEGPSFAGQQVRLAGAG